MQGKFILVIGPSGSGKSALLSYLHEQMPELIFPRSCTTRTPRPGEVEGEKYFFITKEEFEKREVAGDFLEWASYGGNYYGTLKGEILPALEQGKNVVREVEVQGARQIQTAVPADILRMIFIDAGSWEDLEQRIRSRAPITEVELLARRKRYEDETAFKAQATAVIRNPNGGLEQAKQEFVRVIREFVS
ncbi:MAG TPA: guanylate kinase [Candidatus Paceibacterota bacterium]|nr:guanylate kinase [Candidatus Paceibacterota bacterium]